MKLPRFLHKLYAFLGGYFWPPCPICGENFGGHEWSESLMTSWNTGIVVCPNCVKEAMERNAKWMAENPPPPIEVDIFDVAINKNTLSGMTTSMPGPFIGGIE